MAGTSRQRGVMATRFDPIRAIDKMCEFDKALKPCLSQG